MSSSDEDDERLKAALDPSLLESNLYGKKSEDTKNESSQKKESHHITSTNNGKNQEKTKSTQKSLRRDRVEDEGQKAVISELQVTPEFQAFVAKQLDSIITKSIEETSKLELKRKLESTEGSSIKLLKKSLNPVDLENSGYKGSKKKPDLLKHRSLPDTEEISTEVLSNIAVTSEQVLAKHGTEHYANRFAGRVEEGIARIKRKKKKIKKNKKNKEKDEKETVKEESKDKDSDSNSS